MEQNLTMEALKLIKRQKRHRLWTKLLSVMACVVVFCTTYALILPAITKETNVFCGQEGHVHDESCYEERLICGYAEMSAEPQLSEHVHSSDCYLTEKQLICQLPECEAHIHSEACKSIDTVLSCGMEERAGHTHGADCQLVEKVLICELPEDETHTHGDGCYSETVSIVCGLEETTGHTHDDSCYTSTESIVCGLQETEGHSHSDACYGMVERLVCEVSSDTESSSGEQFHEHTDACYEKILICKKEEHEHTLSCYSDSTADVELKSQWESTLPDEYTGEYAVDVLAVAKSQLGYTESSRNYQVMEDGVTTKGYTRYGAWYGVPYGDWCAMFVSFCLSYAEVEDYPLDCYCPTWVTNLKKIDAFYTEADQDPVPGDIIFFDWDQDGISDHVGLVAGFTPATEYAAAKIKTIEGNSADRVQYVDYLLSDPEIMGYGCLPEQNFYCGVAGHVHGNDCGSCQLEEHIHSEVCEAAPQDTVISDDQLNVNTLAQDENMDPVEALEVLIDQIPSYSEAEAALLAFENDGDWDGFDSYYEEMVILVDIAFNKFETLTEEEKTQVQNIDKLMELSSFRSVVTLEDTTFELTSSTQKLDPYITNAIFEVKGDNDVWVPVDAENPIMEESPLKVTIFYSIPGNELQNHQTITYELDDSINIYSDVNGPITYLGEKVGEFNINTDGIISMDFYDTFSINEPFSGRLEFVAMVDSYLEGDTNTIVIDDVVGTITKKEDSVESSIEAEKSVIVRKDTAGNLITDDNGNILLDYTVVISSNLGTDDNSVNINDQLNPATAQYVQNSVQLVKIDSQGSRTPVTDYSIEYIKTWTNEFEISNLPPLNANEAYVLTYTVAVPFVDGGGAQQQGNTVKGSAGNKDHTVSRWETIVKNRVTKKGVPVEDGGKIDWTIYIYDVSAGDSIVDIPDDGLIWDGSATISPALGDTTQITFHKNAEGKWVYDFPAGADGDYTITYQTEVPDMGFAGAVQYTNKVTYHDDGEDHDYTAEDTPVYEYEPRIKKSFVSEEESEGGAAYRWSVTVNIDENLDEYIFTDTLTSDSETSLHYIKDLKLSIIGTKADGTTEIVDTRELVIKYFDAGDVALTVNDKPVKFRVDLAGIANDYVSLIISYETWAEYNMAAGETVTYTNTAEIDNNPATSSNSHEETLAVVKKGGMWDGKTTNNQVLNVLGNNPYSAEYKAGDFSLALEETNGYLYYILEIDPGGSELSDEIIIKDNLPDHSSLATDGVYAPFVAYLQNPNVWFYHLYNTYGATISNALSYTVNENNQVTFRIAVSENVRNHVSSNDLKIAIGYALKLEVLDQSVDYTKVYENRFEYEGNTGGQKTTVEHKVSRMDKYGYQVFDENNYPTDTIRYSLTVNPWGEDLLPDNNRVELVDTLSYLESDAITYVEFISSSLKVYSYDPVTGQKGGLIAPGVYSYSYDTATHTLKVDLPDNLALVIEYDYEIKSNKSQGEVILNNRAVLHGEEDYNDDVDIDFNYQDTSAEVFREVVTLKKVDSQNSAILLSGATFELYKADTDGNMTNDQKIGNAEQVGESGTLDIVFATTYDSDDAPWRVDPGTLYYLKETIAPDGYILPEDNLTYFYILESGETLTAAQAEVGVDWPGINVTYINSAGGSLYISNEYSYLEAKKIWVNPDGTEATEHPETIDLELWMTVGDGNPQKVDDVTLGTGKSDEKTPKIDDVEVKRIVDGWTVIWEGLPKFKDGEACVFHVVEKDVPDGWSVSYNGNYVTNGTVTVTNQQDEKQYILPETGGAGTRLYTLVGLLLMATAALAFLMYKSKLRRREEPDSS